MFCRKQSQKKQLSNSEFQKMQNTQRKQDQLLETTQERAKSAPSTPEGLSCFKSQFVLLPVDLTSKGAKEQIHDTFR